MSLAGIRLAKCVGPAHLWILSDRFHDVISAVSERWDEFVPYVSKRLKRTSGTRSQLNAAIDIAEYVKGQICERRNGRLVVQDVGSDGSYVPEQLNVFLRVACEAIIAQPGIVSSKGVPAELSDRVWQRGNIILPKSSLRKLSMPELLHVLVHEHLHRSVDFEKNGRLREQANRIQIRLLKRAPRNDMSNVVRFGFSIMPKPENAAAFLERTFPKNFNGDELYCRVSAVAATLRQKQPTEGLFGDVVDAYAYFCSMLEWCDRRDRRMSIGVRRVFGGYLRHYKIAEEKAAEDFAALKKAKYI